MPPPANSSIYFRSLVVSYLAQAVALGGAFLTTPVFLDVLGREAVGVWLVTMQVVGYLLLVDFGLAAGVGRQLGAIPVSDSARSWSLVKQATGVGTLQSLGMAAIVAILWWNRWPIEDGGVLLIVGVSLIVSHPFKVLREVLRARLDVVFLGGLSVVSSLLTLVLQLVFVHAGKGVQGLALGWALGETVAAVVVLLRFLRMKDRLLGNAFSEHSSMVRWGEIGWIAVSQFAQVLVGGTELVVVSELFGNDVAAGYAVSTRLMSVLIAYPRQVLLSGLPVLVVVATDSGKDAMVERLRLLGTAAIWMLGGVGAVVAGMGGSFVNAWVGSGLYVGDTVLLLFCLISLARLARLVPAVGLTVEGEQRMIAVTLVFSGVFGLVLSSLGGALGGIRFVLCAYLVSCVVFEVLPVFFAFARRFPTGGSLVRWMSGLVSGVGLMWLTADALGGVAYDRGGWSAVVVKAGVGIVVYAVFSLVLLRTPDGRRLWRYSFERVRLKIRRS